VLLWKKACQTCESLDKYAVSKTRLDAFWLRALLSLLLRTHRKRLGSADERATLSPGVEAPSYVIVRMSAMSAISTPTSELPSVRESRGVLKMQFAARQAELST